ncbi:helix-turn-helix transcriptional regulator [Nocardia sp. alder85J]|uniref:helix-turn-helix transcriptional regulator n=1 Tax=Nocardia sp. alder85J TaxID=2862949 RepID=UPI001CD5FBFA|nr:helix-turn-helix transcriptional regulator [Nocardia sp. alder85J]MCX4097040.1 helix-turn-helix transcriptional regulator [Nocardia sp. alder85J]
MTQSEFAEFLIARRALLQPEEVGLPAGRRRRTPGLRREEVAALAGVSVDYLARLEQGRDTNPSTAVLGALADALRLNEVERHHFGKLAMGMERTSTCPNGGAAHDQVTDTLQAVLDGLHPTPAFLVGRWLTVLASNAAWRDFGEPLGLLDPEAEGNLAYYVFAHPRAAEYWRDWPAVADLMVSLLRAARSQWPEDERLGAMIDALHRYPEFVRRWRSHRVVEHSRVTMHLDHPRRGEVEVEMELFSPASDQTMMVWLVDRRRAPARGLRLVNE